MPNNSARRARKRKGSRGGKSSGSKKGSLSQLGVLENLVQTSQWDELVTQLREMQPDAVPPAILHGILHDAPWRLVPAMLSSISQIHDQLAALPSSAVFGPLAAVMEHCDKSYESPEVLRVAREHAQHWAATKQATDLHPGLSTLLRDPHERFVSILGVECPLYREVDTAFGEYMHRHAVPAFGEQCPICMEALAGPEMYALPCGHTMCAQCAPPALRFRPKCPHCSALAADAIQAYPDVYAPGYVPLDAVVEGDLTPEQMESAHPREAEDHQQSVAQAHAVFVGLQAPAIDPDGDEDHDGDFEEHDSDQDDQEFQFQLQQAMFESLNR